MRPDSPLEPARLSLTSATRPADEGPPLLLLSGSAGGGGGVVHIAPGGAGARILYRTS